MQEVLVGSSDRCQINIESDFVSRRHCRLLYSSGTVWIEDLDSSNGTYVGGKRIRPGEQVRVGPSSEVALANRVNLSWGIIRSFQPNQNPNPAGRTTTSSRRETSRATSKPSRMKDTAVETFDRLDYDPVSNLPRAYSSLSAPQATQIGSLFAFISAVLATLGVFFLIEGSVIGSFTELSLDDLLPFFFSFVILFGSLSLSHFLVRSFFDRELHFSPDIFVSGVCSIPFGIAALLSGIVGLFSFSIVMVLMLISFCYIMMIIYSSLTNISGVPNKIAIPSVPLVVAGCAYLSKSFLFVFVI